MSSGKPPSRKKKRGKYLLRKVRLSKRTLRIMKAAAERNDRSLFQHLSKVLEEEAERAHSILCNEEL